MYPYPRLDARKVIELLRSRFPDGFLTLKDLPDPYRFKDMQKAVRRLTLALDRGERIVLIGDYDVDGVVSTTIMRLFFRELGHDLEWIIPNRFTDGYGLSPGVLDRVGEADVILTVDNGIAAHEAARLCREQGIDLIVTDHHIVPDTPPEAYAIVNQKQSECPFPYEEVCGAQIAWYLAAALRRELGAAIDLRDYLDLTALAIVADVMPLHHINRAMVRFGLERLDTTERPAIRAYRERFGIREFTAESVAFGLAPLLNSAGRMEDAAVASDFLAAEEMETARTLLERLVAHNEERKETERAVTREALEGIDPDAAVLVAAGERWHEGVLGIVAARLAHRFERPALVLTRLGDRYKGSGRSWGECDLFALLQGCAEHLTGFGGHRAAVGLALAPEDLDPFARCLQERARSLCAQTETLDPAILGILDIAEVDEGLCRTIEGYEPFGHGNLRPRFIAMDVPVAAVRRM